MSLKHRSSSPLNYSIKIVWRNVFLMTIVHLSAIYGLYVLVTVTNWKTIIFGWFYGIGAGTLGITCGAHRLWCHRSYKARWPLRVLLALFQTAALQNDIYEWCRDHRSHHKFSETDADPHNSKRGFFFAHIGWLMTKKHPEVIGNGQKVDMSDVWSDPIVRFQRKAYLPLVTVFWLLIPMHVPYWFFAETQWNAFFTCVMFRYCYGLHCTWFVNSAAHLWGSRPYDSRIGPVENPFVVMFALGEGYHNYHHTFPWDYSTSELGWTGGFNMSTLLIDLFYLMGLAYDLKTVPPKVIKDRSEKTGDSSLLMIAKITNNKKLVIYSWVSAVIAISWILWFTYLFRLLYSYV